MVQIAKCPNCRSANVEVYFEKGSHADYVRFECKDCDWYSVERKH